MATRLGGIVVLSVVLGCSRPPEDASFAVAPPVTPESGDPMCLPVDTQTRSPAHGSAGAAQPSPVHLGASVGLVQYGLPFAYGPEHRLQQWVDVVVGAPDTPAEGGSGAVRWLTVDRTTGGWLDPLDPVSGEALAPLPGVERFGAAVLAADLLPLHETHVGGTVSWISRSGQEVAIGAPGTDEGAGAVLVYATRIDELLVGTAHDDRDAWSWQLGQTLSSPDPGAIGFGSSLTAPSTRLGTPTAWLAVGAPGGSVVYLYQTTDVSSEGTPCPACIDDAADLVLAQTVTAGALDPYGPDVSGFGAALLADDFDRDGIPDLTIGATGPDAGRVFVIRGRAEDGLLDLTQWLATGGTLPAPDELGSALASGDLFRDEEGAGPRALVAGAPAADAGAGGVCVFAIASASPEDGGGLAWDRPSNCFLNPVAGPTAAHFGAAVAVGNLSPLDSFLATGTAEARVEELAVGAPGARDLDWTAAADEPADGTEPSSGLVVVFRSEPGSGLVFPSSEDPDASERPLGERVLRPPGGSSGFGASLALADVQRSDRPDLLVGAPAADGESGAVQLLNSDAVHGLAGNVGGLFEMTDSEGTAVPVVLVDGTRLFARSELPLHIDIQRPDPGDASRTEACEVLGEPIEVDFQLTVALPHVLGAGEATVAQVLVDDLGALLDPAEVTDTTSAGGAIEVTIEVTDEAFGDQDPANDSVTIEVLTIRAWSGSTTTGWLAIEALTDADCAVVGNPFTLTRIGPIDVSCE